MHPVHTMNPAQGGGQAVDHLQHIRFEDIGGGKGDDHHLVATILPAKLIIIGEVRIIFLEEVFHPTVKPGMQCPVEKGQGGQQDDDEDPEGPVNALAKQGFHS